MQQLNRLHQKHKDQLFLNKDMFSSTFVVPKLMTNLFNMSQSFNSFYDALMTRYPEKFQQLEKTNPVNISRYVLACEEFQRQCRSLYSSPNFRQVTLINIRQQIVRFQCICYDGQKQSPEDVKLREEILEKYFKTNCCTDDKNFSELTKEAMHRLVYKEHAPPKEGEIPDTQKDLGISYLVQQRQKKHEEEEKKKTRELEEVRANRLKEKEALQKKKKLQKDEEMMKAFKAKNNIKKKK